MSTTPPDSEKPAKRDDQRGAPPGHFGNVAFVPTDEQRQQVRTYAKATTVHGERFIAIKMGISLSTLRRHFADDILIGRADVAISLGAQMVNRALDADSPNAKGDQKAQEYVLSRLCGWSTKLEIGDKAARPFGGNVDLTRLSEKDLETYGRLAALAEGVDPDEVIGDAGGD